MLVALEYARVKQNESVVAQLRALQRNRCAICKREFDAPADVVQSASPTWRRQAHADLDHSHRTGLVRGLLCTRCNRNLGWYETWRDSILTYVRDK